MDSMYTHLSMTSEHSISIATGEREKKKRKRRKKQLEKNSTELEGGG